MDKYDFVTIGSGSGLDVANVAANQGLSVAIVEEGPLGGTCLNRGCIPSKQLLYHADIKTQIDRSEAFHIGSTVTEVNFEEIVKDVNDDVSEDSRSIREGLRSSEQIELYEGTAEFTDSHTLEIVSGEQERALIHGDRILIAAGTRPSIPPIRGIEEVDYLTSTEALKLTDVPEHLAIVGGGYIAAELGHFFGTFGADVSIIGRRDNLLPHTDEEIGRAFTEQYQQRFDVYTGYEATRVTESNNRIELEAKAYDQEWDNNPPADTVTINADELLVAAGRQPNTDRLQVERAGIETDDAGFIQTDQYLRTNVKDVWALGDIVGEYLLKHTANHEARTVVSNLFGDDLQPIDYTAMPYAVFAHPEVAGVGVVEQSLDHEEYATATYRYGDTARGNAMKRDGLVKVIIDHDGNILGCHIMGPEASNLIQEVVVAMTAGTGTVHDIRDAVHVHPALSEVVQRAFSTRFTAAGHHHH